MLAPDVNGVVDRVRAAASARMPLRIRGAGTWRNSATVDAAEALDVRGVTGIVEYVPGDLTMTVRAGTTLGEIADATTPHRQWLALDPFGSDDGTIGATVATASAGPLALAFGAPRDVVIGLEVVTGTGSIVRGGGRVVKNVAGFDLVRLFTGSRGTLGAITEVSLRLRGKPPVDETVAIAAPRGTTELAAMLSRIRAWPFTPIAVELVNPTAAALLGLGTESLLLIRIGGNAQAVAAAMKTMSRMAKTTAVAGETWRKYRQDQPDRPVVFRRGDLPTRFVERWMETGDLVGSQAWVTGSPLLGTIRCSCGTLDRPAVSALRAKAPGASLLFDSLPTAALWNAFSAEPEPDSLHGRVRDAFDPLRIMNPGALRLAR